MQHPPNEPPRFVTCQCQHCDGHIEFDASHAGESATCPHCGMETLLFSPPPPPVLKPAKRTPVWIVLAISMSILGAAFVAFIFILGSLPERWEKTNTLHDGNIVVKVNRMYLAADFVPNGPGLGVTPTAGNLHIIVTVSNLSTNQKVEFHTWRNGDARLTDDSGNVYSYINFGYATPEYLLNDATIYPQQTITDNLVFQRPVSGAKWFHLALICANYGGTGSLRFEVPAEIYSSAF